MTNVTELNHTTYAFQNFVLAPFSILTIIINVVFFSIGVKTLKKKAHNMLIISMCGGDCLYGVSLCMLAVKNLLPIEEKNTNEYCFSQLIVFFLSISMTLTIAFMICVERFVTVKTNNYGKMAREDGWKKKLAITLLIMTSSYVIICMLAVPRNGTVLNICQLRYYYDTFNYQLVMGLLSGLFVVLSLGIIILYAIIVLMLMLIKVKIHKVGPSSDVNIPHRRNKNKQRNNEDIEMETSDQSQNGTAFVERINNHQRTEVWTDLSSGVDEKDSRGVQDEVSLSDIHMVHINNLVFDSRSDVNDYNPHTSMFCVGLPVNLSDDNENTHSSIEVKKSRESQNLRPNITWRKWELRAIATSGYVIVSTILLHGPLIMCLLSDAIGKPLPIGVGYVSTLLVSLQCVINPFIYAFRFKELRQAMKNVFCCRRNTTQQHNTRVYEREQPTDTKINDN